MDKDLVLMMKDRPVMRINFDYGIYDVLDASILPYQIRGKLRDNNVSDRVQQRVADRANSNAIISFLACRTLPLDRENAKKVLGVLGLEQAQDPMYRAKVALTCRAVSLQDNYWFKLSDDKSMWKDVDIRQNRLSNVVAQVALHGSSLTLQGKVHTPELTTHGAYAKCWKREDGKLYLYKRGAYDSTESRIEVEVSHLLDKCNVKHLKYSKATSESVYCCKCECMTTDNLSILSGMDFISFCNVNGLDPMREVMKIDSESIYKMFIVDYLISNRDRHGGNWGFFYNCNTMKILGCHPLYDHNNSFDRPVMQNPTGGPYLFNNKMSMKEAAEMAMKRVDFHFTSEMKREDFIVESHYKSFMNRANQLGIKTVIE